ncbi:FMN-dependent NADH-azoreductase [Chitinophaga sp. CF118]|uniref:FMN-dependent NADH-azoreductase n=1 Tax=Chitinophaga sp. CF118 TaxID=1884367 RepID=UPI0008E8F61B|nr:NAD(P)H-dependent oxidoreductase [Chitinophaga sp. CF118]SFD58300.1 FMN-dependent NADH-azoreductase [Chitinophaga sp. CF118]
MKKILNIISSVKRDESFSRKLSNSIIDKLQTVYPGSDVRTRDLTQNPFPHLEESNFNAFYTPEEVRTEEHKEAVKNSDEAISELMDADIVIIGVPMYNFGIPSTLKSWVDHIARRGKTFSYDKGYPEGLVKNKKVYLAIASGGVYSEGPMKDYDFTESFLRAALGFLGMTDITVFRVEGTFREETKETAWPKALNSVQEFAY